MIIVSGKIYLHPGAIKKFLAASAEAMNLAHRNPECRDFVVAADPIEADRVNVYEEWESEKVLLAFRGDGPNSDMQSVIVRTEVFRHVISSTVPAN